VHPWLIRLDLPGIGTVLVQSYFFFLMLACVVGTEVVVREARRSGEPPRRALLVAVTAIVAGLLGARLGHFAFVAPERLARDPFAFLRIWEGGMVFYGGFLGGLAVVVGICRVKGWSLLRYGDLFAAPILVGLAIGRVGCLSNGCCYGRPIDWGTGVEWPWGVTFLAGEVPTALRGVPLHPTQAYAALNAVALLLLVGWWRRVQRFDGQVFGALLIAYGVTRSVLELFRLDTSRSFWFEDQLGQVLSTSQGISIPLVVAGMAALFIGRRRAATTAP